MTFDWTRARAFLATAETGSFSGAARELGIAQTTVGRQVAALEAELDLVLFERVGNRMEPTEAGLELLAPVRAMRDAADRVSLAATGASTSLEGVVRISASDSTCAYRLATVVARLQQQFPRMRIHLLAENTVSDLLRREADIAVRHVRPEQAELVAKRVADSRPRLYANPDYLSRRGRPASTADLHDHTFISWEPVARFHEGLCQFYGQELPLANFSLASSSHVVQWQLCRAGAGIALMGEHIGDADLTVERVLPDSEAWRVPVWLTAHRELRTTPRIRVVYDALVEAMG